jgi:LDH2 family malate/lactate/ureidoglycolate dehydrogenase
METTAKSSMNQHAGVHFEPEQQLIETAAALSKKPLFPQALEAFCREAMLKSGIREEDARITAEVLVTTDTWGVYTHGTKQLRALMNNFRTGRLDRQAIPEIALAGPGWAIVDGHYAMPMTTSHMAMKLAIEKARATGIAYVGVTHSSHFGAAGYYASMAARADMIGLSMCNVDPGVTAPGARGSVLGTNPIAYAVPAGQEPPILLDIATSTVAASKVYVARALGTEIPDNWLVDDEGVPTTDPSHYPLQGALLPMAGHKGYGLALLVEILTSVLTGAGMLHQVKSWVLDLPDPTNEGHAFIAIDVGSIMPIQAFKERLDWVIREIKGAPKAKGSERIYLPGEMEWERRSRALTEGMYLPGDVIASLAGLAEDVGLEFKGLWGGDEVA